MKAVVILLLLSVTFHALVGCALLPDLQRWPWAQALAAVWVLLSACLIPAALIWRAAQGRWAHALSWLGMGLMGLFSSVLVLTLGDGVIQLMLGWLQPQWSFSSAWVLPLASFITLCGLFNARRTAKVVHVDVPIKGLPEALHGFSIAQISDIHVGPTIKGRYLQAIVDSVNELKADMVAVTGDLVDGSVQALASHVAPRRGCVPGTGPFSSRATTSTTPVPTVGSRSCAAFI